MKKPFVDFDNIVGTAYWEFAAGNWDKKPIGVKILSNIHDDDIFHSDFFDIILDIVPNGDPLGKTNVSKEQWEQIREKAISGGSDSSKIVQAADFQATENLQKYNAFYILGV